MNSTTSKVFVIGGTGRTGKIIIEKLLKRGFEVTSISRSDQSKLKTSNNHKWLIYDIYKTDEEQKKCLSEIIIGHSVVISALGGTTGAPADIYYKSYQNLIPAMEQAKVNRLIMITADGTHKDHGFFFRNFVKNLFLSTILKDTEKTEGWIKNNYKGPVIWTIVRPFRLLDGEKGVYNNAFEDEQPTGKTWTWQSYTGDVAECCVQIYEKNIYQNKMISTGE